MEKPLHHHVKPIKSHLKTMKSPFLSIFVDGETPIDTLEISWDPPLQTRARAAPHWTIVPTACVWSETSAWTTSSETSARCPGGKGP